MLLQLLYLVQFCFLTLASSSSVPPFVKTKAGCDAKCGNVSIPYPFGIINSNGNDCSIGETGFDYRITCNTSFHPPKPFLDTGNIEVIDITETEIRINNYPAILCYTESGNVTVDRWWTSTNFNQTPFTLSYTKNMFFGIGCDTYASLYGSGTDLKDYSGSCSSRCDNKESVVTGSCFGKGCCQSTIPKGIQEFMPMLVREKNPSQNVSSTWSFDPCSYAFVAEQDQYTFIASDILEGNNFMSKVEVVPIVLDWAIGNKTCEEAQKDLANFVCQENSQCTNLDNNPGYLCTCNSGYEGNPYLSPGCQDINECEDQTSNPCVGICTNTMGSYNCSCAKGSRGDGRRGGSGCVHSNEGSPIFKISLGIGLGLLFLVIGSSLLYLSLRKRKQILLKAKFFQKNGGLLLKQQTSSQEGGGESSAKIFTAEELKLATNNYDDKLILGRGGHGVVYKGTLSDNRVVAIKKSKIVDESQIEEFINELVILTQVNHRNVVKILGCCLETEVPLLVYEYVSNGTLSQHIHIAKDGMSSSISWESRLRIAAETAGAIAYLHSAASIPIIHRDIKSANVLLDENYTAKVADFGASRLNPLDQNEIDTLVQGTLGYLDPEYHHSGQLTGKSDVYSFGVVLVELLTGERPISLERSEEQRNIASYFISLMKGNNVLHVLETRVVAEGNREQVLSVAKLAKRCLSLKSEDRPTMKEVAMELENLMKSSSSTHTSMQDNYRKHNEEPTYSTSEPTDLYTVPIGHYSLGDSDQFSTERDMSMSSFNPR
ncbi:hypothetical protein C5167_037345 [Papaver somniferum]|uniref:Protein kinase domain-containing protein n=1 Tax=Papaver somniferum TaxID=3469 RepID=A0A4Y7I648_PAPSO|nr:wall-associated receptor kinase 2-like [Papaver somniferum]RZC44397.1 hypothetical protein C5167_037345 [Papaver somniferum]